MAELIKVGMADLKIAKAPDVLTTLGLGSCVGIALYDPDKRLAGLAHIMLPDSTQIKNNANKAKFADTALEILLKEMVEAGALRSRLYAKIAGGAQMFAMDSQSDIMKIGSRNTMATKKLLTEYRIPLHAEDTGGNYGRTIEIHPDSGRLLVKAIGKGMREL
ncbi:chemotaxis protein CheD [Anoxynatronum buryatiense]|uniref:Probable chemoreceptor glutamine deamidase CheD n=1 Tax=Anoxynatronum buryatiense TaxID=489973 RepID=A0AA45WUQ9_9CLOT|nr:chemotaxis protein CheD [Anoxynatronum buryatiense]SMP47445.1 chemotaxis protein CheD [Anoxynatronum buryatiense]